MFYQMTDLKKRVQTGLACCKLKRRINSANLYGYATHTPKFVISLSFIGNVLISVRVKYY